VHVYVNVGANWGLKVSEFGVTGSERCCLMAGAGLVVGDGRDRATDRADADICWQTSCQYTRSSDTDCRREKARQKTLRRETQLHGHGTWQGL